MNQIPPEWLIYANQSATRSRPISPELQKAMAFLPEMGLQMQVFSGGQPGFGSGGARVGSVRHDHGEAADVFFLRDGQRLDWANPEQTPIFQDVVRRAKAAGLTGFGAGPGYMQPGSMHIGYGTPAVWGAGGKGANAPNWLREAYGAAPATAPATKPAVAPPSMTPGGFAGQLDMGTPVAPTLADLFAPPKPQEPSVQQKVEDREAANQRRREALFGGGLFG
ncbi:hypothetical protein PhaeoP66_03199 [Phaeobacter inhibens]|uniref:Peptidase M15A C-terminal domain-containing protein n=1 Tax=Phaeobacter inhibens TaxID=221822 RepID=A0ABM6RHM0_9RHOB|nr:hypothetical protein [Phaeobacter inhibens]AUQ95941.1 hypothetical protein PhaeoP66_03199 [Phaeobacter inhibens]